MQCDLLKPWNEINHGRPPKHPYDKFSCGEIIVHRLGDETYPEIDDQEPGISPWFKVELFDFYHAGIKVILGIEPGVVENDWTYGSGKGWAIAIPGRKFDFAKFRRVNIWKLGLIPFKRIRHYEPHGDEYYNRPHIYCSFDKQAMPYEKFEYAVVGGDEGYDYPLKTELQLSV